MSSTTTYRVIKYPRLTALVAICLAAVNLRTAITAIAPLLSHIQQDLHIGGTVAGIIGTVPTAMFALSAFVLPRIKERLTLSEMMLASLAITALGQFLRVAFPSQWVLLAGSALALFAVGILNATMPLVVREYFPRRVPGMSTTYMVASQLALTIAPVVAMPLARWAEAHQLPGWQVSLGSWGLVSALAAVSWAPLLIRRGPNPIDSVAAPNLKMPVWRTPVGVGLALMLGSNSLVAYTMMTFLPQIFAEAGAPVDTAAGYLAVWTAMGIPVALIGPWLAGRVRKVYPVVLSSSLSFLISLLGMAFVPLTMPLLWVIMSTWGTVIFTMSLVLVNVRARTLDGATALSSFGQGVGYTVACIGPLLTGALHEFTGSFRLPLAILSVIGLVTAVAGYFATRQVFVEDELAAASAA